MKETALYMHVPFCKQKCLYCDFPSFCNMENFMESYVEALGEEINAIKNIKIRTIFIGGGTPTYLNSETLKKLEEIIGKLELKGCKEFTMEGNPGTFTEEKLKIMKDMGVNRLSIGLQATQNDLLKRIGRIHNYEEFIKSYNMARKFGFDNINIDLMFGLPGQTNKMWNETLEKVIKLEPEHLSCYSLIIEEGTPFYNMYNENNLPDEEVVIEMYETAKKILKKNSYFQYEISNFSKKTYECKHNIVYWNLENYIGIGSSAHSYYNGKRYRNESNVKKYIEKIKKEQTAVVEILENTLQDDMEEFVFLGLRKIEGIEIKEFEKRFKKDIYSVYGEVIKKHKEKNLLIESNGKLHLTNRGIEISNYVLSDFIM